MNNDISTVASQQWHLITHGSKLLLLYLVLSVKQRGQEYTWEQEQPHGTDTVGEIEGEGDQKEGGWIVWRTMLKKFRAVAEDVYGRERWRKLAFAIATPHGSGKS